VYSGLNRGVYASCDVGTKHKTSVLRPHVNFGANDQLIEGDQSEAEYLSQPAGMIGQFSQMIDCAKIIQT
jgi:hypothetical protein